MVLDLQVNDRIQEAIESDLDCLISSIGISTNLRTCKVEIIANTEKYLGISKIHEFYSFGKTRLVNYQIDRIRDNSYRIVLNFISLNVQVFNDDICNAKWKKYSNEFDSLISEIISE